MPYKSVNALPAHIKEYGAKIQRQWMHVFNSTWKKLGNEGVTGKNKESRAFKAANSVLKRRFKGKSSMEKNSRSDYFSHLVDQFLGNLTG